MKIRTITCHDVYNLGASLQAFALQRFLESEGHNVEIIDYKPDYLSGHFKLGNIDNPIYDKPVVKQLYLLAKLPFRLCALPRKKAFDRFTKSYLHLTRRYNSYDELKANPPEADVYIAGSDQIWNTLFPNGRDKAFYLDYGGADIKRISYAASFATPCIKEGYEEFVRQELGGIDKVSIRETCSLPLLHELGVRDGVAVCDPVFLLSRKQWCDFLPAPKGSSMKKYLLVYLTEASETIRKIASCIKGKTGWEIITVGGVRASYADKNMNFADPFEFVSLVRSAQFVISNSFHASAFSIIMGVDFCVVNRSEKINERMKSLLDDFGLSERLVSAYSDRLLDKIDYAKVEKLIDEKVSWSKQWLRDAISEDKKII